MRKDVLRGYSVDEATGAGDRQGLRRMLHLDRRTLLEVAMDEGVHDDLPDRLLGVVPDLQLDATLD